MKNFVTDESLKGAFPEIMKYLWKGETDYSKQRAEAEEMVINDLTMVGYDIQRLQIPLHLHSAGVVSANETGTQVNDDISRQRMYYNVTAITGAATLTLEGRNAETGDWETVKTQAVAATGEGSLFIPNVYKYYRLNTTVGTSINYYAYLVENIYTQLFKWKQLELIMANNGDNYATQLAYCMDRYKDVLKRAKLYYDTNGDGTIDVSEATYGGQVMFGRG